MPVKNKIRPESAADEIRSIREKLRLSQEQFAARLQVAVRSVQRWEAGHVINRGTLSRIRALGAAEAGAPSVTPPAAGPQRLPQPGSPRDLHEMLDIILERAPDTMIEAVTDYLFDRAGKYGYFRSPSATRK